MAFQDTYLVGQVSGIRKTHPCPRIFNPTGRFKYPTTHTFRNQLFHFFKENLESFSEAFKRTHILHRNYNIKFEHLLSFFFDTASEAYQLKKTLSRVSLWLGSAGKPCFCRLCELWIAREPLFQPIR